ncbi:hypothetical protein PUN28_010050 [Cardiocondyla obscurior]|uniref:Uncharacterized protein n=1 Tax=Cardiocondyla obscurior TaxID=286306 RepID=A0AAW2FM58_9HYME
MPTNAGICHPLLSTLLQYVQCIDYNTVSETRLIRNREDWYRAFLSEEKSNFSARRDILIDYISCILENSSINSRISKATERPKTLTSSLARTEAVKRKRGGRRWDEGQRKSRDKCGSELAIKPVEK